MSALTTRLSCTMLAASCQQAATDLHGAQVADVFWDINHFPAQGRQSAQADAPESLGSLDLTNSSARSTLQDGWCRDTQMHSHSIARQSCGQLLGG